jgi:small-conductance mechanosensitive channel
MAVDQNTIVDWFVNQGWYLIGILFLIATTMYGFTYLKRLIRYFKIKESKYIDDEILDFLEISIKVLWALVVLFVSILLFAMSWDWFRTNVYEVLRGYTVFTSLMSATIIVVIVGLAIKFIHHVMQYMAGNLKEKPEKTVNPRIALLIELLLKYFLIAFAAVLIITIGLSAIGYYDQIVNGIVTWLDSNKAGVIFIIVAIVLAYFFVKILETFFEDMKKKETPFSPQIMDVAKVISKYTIYLIVGVAVLYSFLQMFALGQTGMIIVGVIIVFLALLVGVAATSNLRNGFSGVLLMAFKPFDEGDRVKICDGLVCDIVRLGIIFTRVKTIRGEIVDIPNNEIMEKPIYNFTKSDEYALSATILVPVDIKRSRVEELLIKAATETKGILSNKKPEVFAIGLEEESVVYELLAYTSTPQEVKKIKSNLVFSILSTFQEEHIPVSAAISDEIEKEIMRSARGMEVKERHWDGI